MLPRGAMILLTSRCQLNCIHCGAIHDQDYQPADLDIHLVKKALVDLRRGKTCIVAYSGGDPILYPDLIEVLEFTRKLGMLAVLGITGVDVTDEMVLQLKKAKVGCVQVSLDGSNALINDAIRGNGNFEKVIDTIQRLSNAAINVNVAICVFKENMSDVENMLSLFKTLHIYKVKIQFWRLVNGIDLHALSEIEEEYIAGICKEFETRCKLDGWIQLPTSNLRMIHSSSIVICANGNICDTRGKVHGSIYTKLPSEVWKG